LEQPHRIEWEQPPRIELEQPHRIEWEQPPQKRRVGEERGGRAGKSRGRVGFDREAVRWARVWIPRRNQGRRTVCLDGSDDLKADLWEAYPGLVIGWREGSIKKCITF
jgi:hypothetical protein